MEEKNTKHRRKLIALLLFLLLVIFAMVFFMMKALAPGDLTPDFAPGQTEENATALNDDNDGEKMETSEGGGAVSITYAMGVQVDLGEEIAKLYFANPSKSNSDMVIQVVVQNRVIAQSGLILTGNQVEQISLKNGIRKYLKAGGYHGKILVTFYDPETGKKETVNTEIPVTVDVLE